MYYITASNPKNLPFHSPMLHKMVCKSLIYRPFFF